MAETAVNIVIDKLIPLLIDQVESLRGVHREISAIEQELEIIQACIRDADEKAEVAEPSSLIKVWVKQRREVAYRIQDVIDEYLFKVAEVRQKDGFGGFLSKRPRHEIADEIGEIRKTLMWLNEARETLGFNPSITEWRRHVDNGAESSNRVHSLRKGAHFMDDDELVGVNEIKDLLRGWLSNGETGRTVISVVGQGGLGKTTVVSNVYKRQKDERSFNSFAWITVSRTLKAEGLLKTMRKEFYEYDGNKSGAREISEIKDMDALTQKLREYLQGRRYMVVFDDVWDIDFWGDVEFALPDNGKKNRIMITTRDRGVADFCRRFALVNDHELKPLPPEDAMKLFHLKAFQFDDMEGCLQELLGLSRDFVKKCEEMDICQVKKSEGFNFHASTKRISIHTCVDDFQNTTNLSKVRSCFVFNFKEFPKSMAESLLSSFKLLIGSFQSSLGNLRI